MNIHRAAEEAHKEAKRHTRKRKRSSQHEYKSLKKKAWDALSRYVRLSSANLDGYADCYTCEKPFHWKQLQAGHAIPGRHGAVLFDLDIIRCQCYSCNVGRRGNYPIFTTKLIEENGLAWWKEKLDGSRKIVKHTRDDLEQLINNFVQRTNELPFNR